MRAPLLAASLVLLVAPAAASEDIAEALDRIAPLVQAGTLEALGGPETAREIVPAFTGRWLTLNNTVRNWAGDRTVIAQRIETLCADDWENIVTFSVLGPDSFHIDQRSPAGEDHGSFDMTAIGDGRIFTTPIDPDYILSIFDLEDAPPREQEAAIAEMQAISEIGNEIWLPTSDILVSRTASEVEVWGRCPD